MVTLLMIAVVVLLVVLSLRERTRQRIGKERAWDGSETRTSPLSQALTNMIGTAGGIYLSLVMLFSFMEIDMPAKIQFLHMELEPLAAISFVLAILQPFVLKIWQLKHN